jgi:hypothetical protein
LPTAQPDFQKNRRKSRILVSLGVALVATALLAGFLNSMLTAALTAKVRAERAQQSLGALASQASTGEFGNLATSLGTASADLNQLASSTQSWQWQVLEKLPVIGPSAGALTVISKQLTDIAAAAVPLSQTVARTTSTAELVASLPLLVKDFWAIADQAGKSISELETLESVHLNFGLNTELPKLLSQLESLVGLGTVVESNADPLLDLMGFSGDRTYLIMLQNPAELRGSGGLFSAFIIMKLTDGTPVIVEANSRKVLDELRIPVPDDLDLGEQLVWGEYLTKWASFSTSGDFPTTARLAAAGMAARSMPVDGVIAIDPVAVQAMLAGTGAVEHQGVSIDATTAANFFLKDIYDKFPGFPDVEAKDQLALGLIYATVDSLLNRPLDIRALSAAITPAIADGHIKVWVPIEEEEDWLAGLGVAARLSDLPESEPFVVFNNATGGKLDAYVETLIKHDEHDCPNSSPGQLARSQSTLSITLTNSAPTGLPPYVDVRLDDQPSGTGATSLLVSIYGPLGSSLKQMRVNGIEVDVTTNTAQGRPLWLTQVELPRGAKRELAITYIYPGAPSC